MGISEEAIEQYKQLYAEIGRNAQIAQNVFVANLAVVGGLIGYGLNTERGIIFLAPFAVIIPSLFFLASQFESTTRIATYIIVFIEPYSDMLKWESRWLQIRQKKLLPADRKYTLSLSGLYILVSAMCILLAFRYCQTPRYWLVTIVIPIIVLLTLGIKQIIRAFSLLLYEQYIESWQKLKKNNS